MRRAGATKRFNYAESLQNQIDYWASESFGWRKEGLYLYRTEAVSRHGWNGRHLVKRRPCFAPVDYIGALLGERLPVFIEVKTFACVQSGWQKTRFPLGEDTQLKPNRRVIIKPHQRETLNLYASLGCPALWLVGIYKALNFVKIILIDPIPAERLLAAKGTKSVSFAELAEVNALYECDDLQTLPTVVRKWLKLKEAA